MIRGGTLLAGFAVLAGGSTTVFGQERPAAADSLVPAVVEPTRPAPPMPGDRIMAVVGNHLILESEWREQVALLANQLGVTGNGPQFRGLATNAFQQMLQDLIIVTAAERDTTIQIDEERVREETDREIEEIRARFPSAEAFQQELRGSQWGSLAAYRADLMDRKRRELLGDAFLQLHRDEIQPAPVSDEDVQAFWEENRSTMPQREETVRFEEIPVVLEPDAAARDSARTRAEAVLAELRTGLDFEAAARQHSDDLGTREQGGDLGWFGRGRMVPSFEKAAFEAPLGELVGPVESSFGYHILQVIDRRADEVRARHILIAFERADADRERARERAEELRDRILSGANVDSLQAALMPEDSIGTSVIELPPDQLPGSYADVLEGLESGEVGIVETGTGFSVVVSRGRGGGGDVTFEDMAPRIRQQLAAQRAQEAFVERLRGEVYVDIRTPPEEVLGR
ncbi:MAG: peptidylprolyl isomerase [Gemmatimonadota bacterium]